MATPKYRYAGLHVTAQGSMYDVQHDNMGMLELDINNLVPGAKDPLVLSLQSFKIPARDVKNETLHYLNGSANYPSKPTPMTEIEATFVDYPFQGIRHLLLNWFNLVYDENTGYMTPTSWLKTTGHVVLFAFAGGFERSATLYGLWPKSAPPVDIDFSKGAAIPMNIKFSIDRIVWNPALSISTFGAAAGIPGLSGLGNIGGAIPGIV